MFLEKQELLNINKEELTTTGSSRGGSLGVGF
jgi:hypothetical protein